MPVGANHEHHLRFPSNSSPLSCSSLSRPPLTSFEAYSVSARKPPSNLVRPHLNPSWPPNMACDFLSRSGPPELVLLILEACESTNDALALTATCCYLHSVGRCYAVSRLSSSAFFREIPCFENALTAVCISRVLVLATFTRLIPLLGLYDPSGC